jgi:hypothetical protein
MITGRGFGGRFGKRSIINLRGGGGGGGITSERKYEIYLENNY